MLSRPAVAGAYPGYRPPDSEHRTRAFLTWAALVHAAAIALLFALASLAPEIEERILHLQILKPPPPPPPVVVPEPEPPPPPPVKVELPKPPPPPPPVKPKPKPKIEPVPEPVPVPVPVVKRPPPPKPPPPVARPQLAPAPALPQIEPLSTRTPDRVERPVLPPRAASNVRVPTPQIDRATVRADLAMPAPAPDHRPTAPRAARSTPPPPPPAAIDRVAVPRPEAAPPAPAVPRAAPPPKPARTARPELAMASVASEPRNNLRGVPLSALLPCVSDARETELKQRTVAAARNRALCESPAGRFHFVETKNVNAFLMRIEQAGSRQSGDRCEELKLALDCLASLPPRSR